MINPVTPSTVSTTPNPLAAEIERSAVFQNSAQQVTDTDKITVRNLSQANLPPNPKSPELAQSIFTNIDDAWQTAIDTSRTEAPTTL